MVHSIRDSTHVARAAGLAFLILAAITGWGCELVVGDLPPSDPAQPDAPDGAVALDTDSGTASGDEPGASEVSTAFDHTVSEDDAGDAGRTDSAGLDDRSSSSDRDTGVTTDAPSDNSSTFDAPKDQSAPPDTSVDQSVPSDAPADTSAPRDVTQDPGVDAFDPCDQDGDGFRKKGTCGGTDCDDTSNLVYPGEPDYQSGPTHVNGSDYDYDCSGQPDPEFLGSVDCAALPLGLGCGSPTNNKFLGATAPPCGQKGNYGHCVAGVLKCDEQVLELNKTMRCK